VREIGILMSMVLDYWVKKYAKISKRTEWDILKIVTILNTLEYISI